MANVDHLKVTELESYAANRDACVIIMGMMGCDPCKNLLAQVQACGTLDAVDIGYCSLRPSHFRAMKDTGALSSAPTTFVYRSGQELTAINMGGPMTVREDAFLSDWWAKIQSALTEIPTSAK